MTNANTPIINAAYTLTPGRTPVTVFLYGGPYTVTFPDATLFSGKKWILIWKTNQTITLQSVKSQKLDGVHTSIAIASMNYTVEFNSDGVNWVQTNYARNFPQQRVGDGQIVNSRLTRYGTV